MKDSTKLRRQLYLTRFLDKPDTYPSLEKLCHYLRDQDIACASPSSIERDLRDIRAESQSHLRVLKYELLTGPLSRVQLYALLSCMDTLFL